MLILVYSKVLVEAAVILKSEDIHTCSALTQSWLLTVVMGCVGALKRWCCPDILPGVDW